MRSIGFRLTAGFAAVLALLVLLAGFALHRLQTLGEVTRQVIEGSAARAQLAQSIHTQAEAAAGRLLLLFLFDERETRVALYGEIDRNNNGMDDAIERLAQLPGASGDMLAQLQARRAAYREHFFATVELIEGGELEAAKQSLGGATRKALDALLAETARLAQQEAAAMRDAQARAADLIQDAQRWAVLLTIATVLLGLLVSLLLTASIVRGLRRAVQTADQVAAGDLATNLAVRGKDEIARLLRALEAMRGGLRDVILGIRGSADEVRMAAGKQAAVVTKVADESAGQGERAAAIRQTIADFAKLSHELSTGVASARERAVATKAQAERGEQLIRQASEDITRIAEAVAASADGVKSLRQRALDVRSVVDSIREIADQTNLLAVNAAVEAARAGAAGRGFAVVAAEVRRLAQRAAQATVEVKRSMAPIDSETAIAAERIGQGQAQMNESVQRIEAIVQPLAELRAGAEASFSELQKLEDDAAQQSERASEMERHVAEIAAISARNQKSSAVMLETTQVLDDLAGDLWQRVEVFRT